MATPCQPWFHKSRIVSFNYFRSVSSAVKLCPYMGTNFKRIHRAVFAGGWAVIARTQFLFFQVTASVHLCVTLAKCFVFAEGQLALV